MPRRQSSEVGFGPLKITVGSFDMPSTEFGMQLGKATDKPTAAVCPQGILLGETILGFQSGRVRLERSSFALPRDEVAAAVAGGRPANT